MEVVRGEKAMEAASSRTSTLTEMFYICANQYNSHKSHVASEHLGCGGLTAVSSNPKVAVLLAVHTFAK